MSSSLLASLAHVIEPLTCLPMFLVHLERLGSLPEDVVRFYIAEIGSALAFLHEHKIIHRLVS